MKITREQIVNALSGVIEPDLGKDIVSLDLVSGIEIKGNTMELKLRVIPFLLR